MTMSKFIYQNNKTKKCYIIDVNQENHTINMIPVSKKKNSNWKMGRYLETYSIVAMSDFSATILNINKLQEVH